MVFCYSSLNGLKQWPNFGLVRINQEDNACKTPKQKVTLSGTQQTLMTK